MAGVKPGEDLQQTVCEQTAGYEIHRNRPISIRHRSDSRWREIALLFLLVFRTSFKKHLLLKGFYPSCTWPPIL